MKNLVLLGIIVLVVSTSQANNSDEELENIIEEFLERHRLSKKFMLDKVANATKSPARATQSLTTKILSTKQPAPIDFSTIVSAVNTTATTRQEPSIRTTRAPIPITTTTIQTSDATHEASVVMDTRKIQVHAPLENIWAYAGKATQLFCDYTISTGEDLPVTITWKVGDGPRFAHPIFVCTGWTYTSKRCSEVKVEDIQYDGRVRIGESSPSLEIIKVDSFDRRNYWCQISVEDPEDRELEFDMQSMVLVVQYPDGQHTPTKLRKILIDNDKVATAGNSVTLHCECHSSGVVYWYKGPLASSDSSYDLVYSHLSNSSPNPNEYVAYNQWQGRSFLTDNSLNIINVNDTDSGRYWCEVRSGEEWATDAESVVLEVRQEQVEKEPFDCLSKSDGVYSDPQSCNHYYECKASTAYHRLCPFGTVFNSNSNSNPQSYICDYTENVTPPCGTKNTIT